MNNHIPENIAPVESVSVTQQATDILSGLITSGKYQVGQYLPSEDELCQALKVSRSTVREAIKTLESRGMVKKQHGKGVLIVDESLKATSEMLKIMFNQKKSTLVELIEFRNVLEVKIAELAASRATESDIADIEKHLVVMQNERTDLEEFIAADFEFHRSVAQASGNTIFELVIESVRPLLYDQILTTLRNDINPERSCKYHEKIYLAIRQRDAQKAASAMKEHLIGTKNLMR